MEGLKYNFFFFFAYYFVFCHSRVEHGLRVLLEVLGALRLLHNRLEDLYCRSYGWGMWHVWGRRDMYTRHLWVTLKDIAWEN
jgi:hypothetical protein